eukprot:4137781-Amphidinium_carterae.1
MFQNLRFPIITPHRQLQTTCEIMMTAWIAWRARVLHARKVSADPSTQPAWRAAPKACSKRAWGQHVLVLGMTWNLWCFLCFVASAPAAVYAAVQAVPGFLDERWLQEVLNATVSLLTAALTAFILPKLAKLLPV